MKTYEHIFVVVCVLVCKVGMAQNKGLAELQLSRDALALQQTDLTHPILKSPSRLQLKIQPNSIFVHICIFIIFLSLNKVIIKQS